MILKAQIQIALSRKGKRNRNEDFIVPSETSGNSNVFVVCDGVGGNHEGAVASKILAESVEFYLNRKNPILFSVKSYLNKSLRFAEERLSEYIEHHPHSKGMASTIACLEFGKKKVLGFWVGDSKIYHIREGKILFESTDHTLYQELKNQPETDQDKLNDFPYKNYILRAVKGNHSPADPEYFISSDLKKNDTFILLTDGIKEAFSKNDLIELIQSSKSLGDLEKSIENQCEEKSNDNYSIIILKLAEE